MTAARKCRIAIAALCLALPAAGRAAGELENPAPSVPVSGIGLVSGWHCTASRIEVEFDGTVRLAASHGTDRLDTQPICGRRDTGFGLLFNWALLGAGNHTVRALADGVEFARRTFSVVSLGGEFLTGRSAETTLHDFPSVGRSTVLQWREATQSFVVSEVRETSAALDGRWNGADLERRSNCASSQNNGTRGTYAQYDIVHEAPGLFITQTGITGLNCTYSGPFRQEGTRRDWSGTYTCTDGKRGDFTSTGFLVTPNEMSIRLSIKLSGSETCDIDAILGGSRF